MRYVITGATGLIGKHLIQHWLNQKHDITVIGRTQQRITNQFGNTVRAVTWDALTSDDLKSAALVVNLAGASLGDKRWTEAYKK
jgi:NAD dependent epimerase/dehydratase family enzyme